MISRAHMVSSNTEDVADTIVKELHPTGQKCLQKFLIKNTSVLWAKLKDEMDFRQRVTQRPDNLVDVTFGKAITKILGFLSKRRIYCHETCTNVNNRPKTFFKAKALQLSEKAYCLRRSFTYRIYGETKIYHYLFISPLAEAPRADHIYTIDDKESAWVNLDEVEITSIICDALSWNEGNTTLIQWKQEELAVILSE